MKKYLFSLMFLLLIIQIVSCKAKDNENRPINDTTPEIVKVPLGDPFIMLWEGKYYAYGTHAENGIAVFISVDLVNWSTPPELYDGLALRKNDVWADRWF